MGQHCAPYPALQDGGAKPLGTTVTMAGWWSCRAPGYPCSTTEPAGLPSPPDFGILQSCLKRKVHLLAYYPVPRNAFTWCIPQHLFLCDLDPKHVSGRAGAAREG